MPENPSSQAYKGFVQIGQIRTKCSFSYFSSTPWFYLDQYPTPSREPDPALCLIVMWVRLSKLLEWYTGSGYVIHNDRYRNSDPNFNKH